MRIAQYEIQNQWVRFEISVHQTIEWGRFQRTHITKWEHRICGCFFKSTSRYLRDGCKWLPAGSRNIDMQTHREFCVSAFLVNRNLCANVLDSTPCVSGMDIAAVHTRTDVHGKLRMKDWQRACIKETTASPSTWLVLCLQFITAMNPNYASAGWVALNTG